MKQYLESRCEQLDVRGLRYNVRHWGEPDAPPVFFFHGWMDSSATFQFVVDALEREWHVIAPDWRGYGATQWLGTAYQFADYYGDLDALLTHYSPDRPARLVGHSMGANIASIYASVRPQRVSQVALLDFLGLPEADPAEAPAQLRKWLDGVADGPARRAYPDHDAFARRLMQANPRLSQERANFLARHIGRRRDDGQVEIAADPWHKVRSAKPYRLDEAMACWRAIEAPALMLIADRGYIHDRFDGIPGECQRRLDCFAQARVVTIRDAGHNIQHDQPEQVAAALEEFLTRD